MVSFELAETSQMFVPGKLRSTLALILFSFQSGCDQAVPPSSGEPMASLSVLETSCTEAWIEITLNPGAQPRTIELRRVSANREDTLLLFSTMLASSDTLIVDQSLLPSSQYSYSLSVPGSLPNQTIKSSALTLDTTSHQFVWTIDTLGEVASQLRDIAIINDTLAYAVGEMYFLDSVGHLDPLAYNLAKWDGRTWTPMRATVDFRGSQITLPLEGIFALSSGDIWLAGSIPIHGDGRNWIAYDIQALIGAGATVSKVWGVEGRTYFVGRAGSLLYFDGTIWHRLNSHTNNAILEIHGRPDGACIQAVTLSSLIRVNQSECDIAYDATHSMYDILPDTLCGVFHGVLSVSDERLYVASSSGLYLTSKNTRGAATRLSPVPGYFPGGPQTIAGLGHNDLVVAGFEGTIAHWNGSSWQLAQNIGGPNAWFLGAALTNHTCIAVGFSGSVAIVARGTR
jgi:hypothetical protein